MNVNSFTKQKRGYCQKVWKERHEAPTIQVMKSFLTHWGSDGGFGERHHEYLCYTCELKAVKKRNG